MAGGEVVGQVTESTILRGPFGKGFLVDGAWQDEIFWERLLDEEPAAA